MIQPVKCKFCSCPTCNCIKCVSKHDGLLEICNTCFERVSQQHEAIRHNYDAKKKRHEELPVPLNG